LTTLTKIVAYYVQLGEGYFITPNEVTTPGIQLVRHT